MLLLVNDLINDVYGQDKTVLFEKIQPECVPCDYFFLFPDFRVGSKNLTDFS